MKTKDRIGQRFGRWTVVGVAPRLATHSQVRCRCDCGRVRIVPVTNLTRGLSSQCFKCGAEQSKSTMQAKALAAGNADLVHAGELKNRCQSGCGTLVNPPSHWCARCLKRHMSKKFKDVAIKYPVSIGTLARANKISRQAVSDYIKRYGWNAAAKRYGVANA